MEKLELKHIAPYLPYGLKWKFDGEDFTHDIVGLDITNRGVKLVSPYNDYGDCEISSGKPLLLPMSSLYKEIDGKVGIVDLAKISADFKWKLGRFYCDGEYIDVAECRYGVFLYNKSNRVFELCNIYGLCGVAPNQLDLFTYLFQHHYDVFSLIDKGLAIDLSFTQR